jgi:hypothetical protein
VAAPMVDTTRTGTKLRLELLLPTKIVFSDASVVVADDPHQVLAKLKGGAVEFQQHSEGSGPVHFLNPALILYLEKIDDAAPSAD